MRVVNGGSCRRGRSICASGTFICERRVVHRDHFVVAGLETELDARTGLSPDGDRVGEKSENGERG